MRVFPNGSGLLLGLLITFACAWLFPNKGEEREFFFPEIVSKLAIVLIFLVQGWNLKISSFRMVYKEIYRVVLVNGLIFIWSSHFCAFILSSRFSFQNIG